MTDKGKYASKSLVARGVGRRQRAFAARAACWLMLCAWLCACTLARGAPAPPAATPQQPQARILYPAHTQQVLEGVIFDIDILASDTAQGIERVELYVDEALLQSSRSEDAVNEYRVTMNWFARGLGWHKFSAIAYAADGSASHPHIIALEVIPPG